MKELSCAIIGGNLQQIPTFVDKTDKHTIKLKDMIIAHIISLILDAGVTYFMSGMELGAELYAAETIVALKKWFPEIKLECVFPHEMQAASWPEYYRHKYYKTAEYCDKETFITRRYGPECYEIKNRYLIANADYLLLIAEDSVAHIKLIED